LVALVLMVGFITFLAWDSAMPRVPHQNAVPKIVPNASQSAE